MDTNAEDVKEAASTHLSDEEAEQRLGEMFRELKTTLRAKSKNELVRVAASLALELFKQRTINEALHTFINKNNNSNPTEPVSAVSSGPVSVSSSNADIGNAVGQAKVD